MEMYWCRAIRKRKRHGRRAEEHVEVWIVLMLREWVVERVRV